MHTDKEKQEKILSERQMSALEKANTEFKKADKIQSDFLSMVNHELRTPLASIKEGVSLVLDEVAGSLNEKQKNFLNIVKRNVDRLSGLINGLLDLSKMEAGKMELIRGNIDINELAREATSAYENTIYFELAKDLPHIFVDRDKTISVLSNLVSNALKFTSGDKGITVRTARFNKDPNFILVSVQDSGRGIAKKDIHKIFVKFRQLEDILTRKVGGTGLGLVIAKDIVELQGGKIWVESEEGKGSSFSFVLPKQFKPARK